MKKPQLPKTYIARDRSGIVWLFPDKPIKDEIRGKWVSSTFRIHLDGTLTAPEHRGQLEPHWEDEEPLEVAICLVPYNSVNVEDVTRIDILTR